MWLTKTLNELGIDLFLVTKENPALQGRETALKSPPRGTTKLTATIYTSPGEVKITKGNTYLRASFNLVHVGDRNPKTY
ncbi:hypothetical protein GCM10007112_09260 [Vulcanisaeta souniana JCM 11219]|uniref:Uncharacterized protein n=1 Tax=Vulcanisaeta souniana JCM 11219 TaxID=1293586 RepID=A0A830E223_9CREN|nr:hypothetical protein GCM10007112_09260 [Vulcanisaeta souniana JCM 11219]